MKERMDLVLKYSIYLYGLIYITSLIAVQFEFDNVLIKLIYTLTFSGCEYGPNFYSNCTSNNLALMILAVLVVIRFIVFGKTYQK